MSKTSPRKIFPLNNFTEQDADRAHALRVELIALRISATEQFFRAGEILKEIRDMGYWQLEGYESFEAYFADPELGLKRSSVYHAIKLVDTFPKRELLLDIPVSKLIMIAPHVDEKNLSDLLAAAKGLSRSDLKHELRRYGMQSKGSRELEVPKIYACNTCGGMKGIRWDELCHCGWTKEQILHIGTLIDKVELGGDLDEKRQDDY